MTFGHEIHLSWEKKNGRKLAESFWMLKISWFCQWIGFLGKI
jgi:hypothetical protein